MSNPAGTAIWHAVISPPAAVVIHKKTADMGGPACRVCPRQNAAKNEKALTRSDYRRKISRFTLHSELTEDMTAKGLALFLAANLGLLGAGHAAVGYYNVALTNGYNFVSLPLDYDGRRTNNTVSRVFGTNFPNGTKIFLWDVPNQTFTPPSTFSTIANAWTTNYTLPVGQGFVVLVDRSLTLTVVGNVLSGYFTNQVAGNNNLSLLSISVPLSAGIPGFELPQIDGSRTYLFGKSSQTYSDGFCYYAGYGWFDPNYKVGTNGPLVPIGDAFFVRNPGPDSDWIYKFELGLAGQSGTKTSDAPKISSLRLSGPVATLQISNPKNVPYNVQFSTNCLTWTTIATQQHACVWKGTISKTERGFYQLNSP